MKLKKYGKTTLPFGLSDFMAKTIATFGGYIIKGGVGA